MNYENEIIYSEESTVLRKIANKETMTEVRKMLRGVIREGTGENADIVGWKVAGKTGTAQKWKNGKYSNTQFISNFVGFFPFDDPQLLAFILLDEPMQPYHWGSEGAAIAFNRIIKRIISMDSSIEPPVNINQLSEKPITNQISQKRREKLEGFNVITKENHYLTQRSVLNKSIVPEIRGFSMRKAMFTLKDSNLNFKLNGSGQVIWQSPKPGSLVDNGTICIVGLK